MKHRSLLLVVLFSLLSMTLLAACGGNDPHSSSGQRLRIEGSEFRFSPATVELTAGKPVTIQFVNTGTVEHDLQVIDMPATVSNHGHGSGNAAHAHAMPGKSESITFTPKATGTYQFICTVPGHQEAGMAGTFTVR